MPPQRRRATLAGVDQLRAGDHAFVSFSDDRARLDVLGVFTRLGLARGERVMLSVDTSRPLDEVAAEVSGGSGPARDAIGRGQLIVSGTPRFQPGSFDAAELAARARERLDAAIADGFSGVRAGYELSPSLVPFDSVSQLAEFERTVHRALVAADTAARYTALCHWDERRLGGGTALDEVRSIHPVTILSAPGSLRVASAPAGLRLAGDADLSTREAFTAALRALEDLPLPAEQTLVLDLSRLTFLDAYGAGAILRLAVGLSPPRRLEVRCRPYHRRMLNILGARSIRRLTITASGSS